MNSTAGHQHTPTQTSLDLYIGTNICVQNVFFEYANNNRFSKLFVHYIELC